MNTMKQRSIDEIYEEVAAARERVLERYYKNRKQNIKRGAVRPNLFPVKHVMRRDTISKMQFKETRFEFQMLSIHEQLSSQKRKSIFDKDEEEEEVYENQCQKRNILKHLFQLF
ncbi:hypothetical protein HDV01_001788 [Terramyces sp. JEL0728]|nr:hypothetical protein HDV01_001788 [Terramyces sp. JEL0728]